MVGLTQIQAKQRLEKYGFNEITIKDKYSLFKIFINQYKDIFSLLLIISTLVSLVFYFIGLLNSLIDFYLIFSILLINGVIGTYQEYKSEKTLEKLKKLQINGTRVFRDNKLIELDSKELVPGDIIVLEEGDKICADCKILKGNLSLDESSFTGESLQIYKKERGQVYSGTLVTGGKALLEVEQTGLNTKFGGLTKKLAKIKDVSFFKTQIDGFTKKLLKFILVIIVIFFGVNLIQSNPWITVLLASIALAVAIVPEGLTVTTIITMIKGIKNLAAKKVLVKKIDAVEILGATEYLIFDKTGTLTEGKIQIAEVYSKNNLEQELAKYKIRHSKDLIEQALPTQKELKPYRTNYFDYKTNTSSIIYRENGIFIEYIKGSPESILKECNTKLSIEETKKIKELLANGYKVLGFAKRRGKTTKQEGFAAFSDKIRWDSAQAIQTLKMASINPIIITGDHKATASHVGKNLGFIDNTISGEDVEKLNNREIIEALKDGGIVYRALPETKLKIISAFIEHQKVVAATGDGVNDVLLLKKASVGIAMGAGTDVAKEAADIVLLNDSLMTITNGIIEGRNIIQNIRKFITFLLSSNGIEAISNLIFPFISTTIPLNAAKLLWVNLISDGFPAISFGLDPVNEKLIFDKPSGYKQILTKVMTRNMILNSIIIGILIAILFFVSNIIFGTAIAITITFTGLVLSQLINATAIRHLFKESLISNKFFILAIGISAILQIVVVYTPLNKLFGIIPLGLYEWITVICFLLISGAIQFVIAYKLRD
jgi:Ca2+-transporting ATPase